MAQLHPIKEMIPGIKANAKNADFDQRKRTLIDMAATLGEPKFANTLVNAYLNDTGYLRRDVYDREIKVPISILKQVGLETEYTSSFGVDLANLAPLGKVAVILPQNGINILIAKAVGSSFLIGNHTLIKLPRKLKHSYPLYSKLVSDHLGDYAQIVPQEESSEEFLNECIFSPDIKAILIYGDDKWMWPYKDAVRRSKTKLIFEGPGKDPQIVMADADLSLAVADAVKCGLLNGGQSCSAIERFFVHESVLQEFVDNLAYKLAQLKIGDSREEDTDIGPINSDLVLEKLVKQVDDALSRGAKLVMGGKKVEINKSGKYCLLPTILTECKTSMDVVKNENFGPVFPILSFSSEEDLLQKIEDSNYGLNASLYGSCSDEFIAYLHNSHRNMYLNSTVTSPCNSSSRILDGGFKNSGFVWEWRKGSFIQREGRRILLKELSATT